jgi:hypothetical protein
MQFDNRQLKSRTRNFRQRLEIERQVLSVVNANQTCPELLGLTEASILRWRNDATNYMTECSAERISSMLTMIARETGTISDNSRLIVTGEAPSARTEDLIASLSRELPIPL